MCTELKIRVRRLCKDTPGIKITVTCEPDDIAVRGNASASGDDAHDKQVEDDIIRRKRSNVWAWCCVRVEVNYLGLSAYNTVGCCSYKSREDFIENAEYEDMVDVCLGEIQSWVDEIVEKNAVIA